MERKLTDFLNEPLSGGRLKLIPSLLIFIVSVFVNAYFQVTSFSTLVSWILETSKTADAAQLLEDILARSDTAIGVRIAFGLLMTVFAMAFLLIAAYWEEKEKNAVHLFERACATMLVPELLMFVAALLMNVSLVAGVVLGIAAATSCVAIIMCCGKKSNINGYLLIALSSAFFMITVVMLTRNHLVTMLGSIR